jgi:Lactoylglutathione lyase and related lyases
MNLKLEVISIPVSDVDRAKKFYHEALGFRLDADFDLAAYEKLLGFKLPFPPDFRAVQLTPPGSACSIHLGKNTSMKPGSLEGMYLVTDDIQATRSDLVSRGVEVSEPYHLSPKGQTSGIDPEHQSYNTYMTFKDPDGNSWTVQEIRKRLPGRE